MSLTLFLTLLTLATSLTLPHPSSLHQQCPVVLPNDPPSRTHPNTPRIVGGDFISPTLRPSLAALRSSTASSICTASLISTFWLITAAHCRVDTTWTASVNTDTPFSSPVIPIRSAIPHPNYSDLNRNFDIALIRLARPAPSTSFILLNINATLPVPTSFARVMGYGVTVFNAPEPSEDRLRLRQVDVPVETHRFCSSVYDALDPSAQLCAGYRAGGCDSCQGDSGGPLIQYDDAGSPVQIGIVSFGNGCAEPGSPGVYVRTSFHIQWMIQQGAEFDTASSTRPVFSSLTTRGVQDDTTNTPIIIGAAAGGVVLIAAFLIGILFAVNRKRSPPPNLLHPAPQSQPSLMPTPQQQHPVEHLYPPGLQHPPPNYHIPSTPLQTYQAGVASPLHHDQHTSYSQLYAEQPGYVNPLNPTVQPVEPSTPILPFPSADPPAHHSYSQLYQEEQQQQPATNNDSSTNSQRAP